MFKVTFSFEDGSHKSCTGGICLYGKHSRKIESSASSEMETEIILVCGNQAV